ncbi:hypothetical protein FS749_015763 [Ceratobasidium sp. UAMH 11750]|nr:hypothetical protein FS749_015763 [Ceratobasidium sp. UAMH 11750]
MDYGYEMELDPVQWQSTQKQVLGDVFRDAPAPPPPPLPTERPVRVNGTRNLYYGMKRKRRSAPDNDSQRSQDNTSELLKQLEHGLSNRVPVNPARRNTRIASASAVMLGPSVGASTNKNTVMPPPKLKSPKSSVDLSSLDKGITPPSDAETFNWSKTESLASAATAPRVDLVPTSASSSRSGSSSNSNQTITALPCTPPNRTTLSDSRPTSMPTLPASSLISPEQDTDSPPSPPTAPKPVLSIRTKTSLSSVHADTSAFSTRSDSASTTASAHSNATATTVPEDQVSPITPAVHRESLPIIDLTLTPTPSPPSAPKPPQTRSTSKAPPAAAASSSRRAPQAPESRPAPAPTRSAPSEPQPPRVPVQLPVRSKTTPTPTASTTTTSRPPSQQWPRVFPSSQTRLGLGAMGKGYDAASRPFRVPNKGKTNIPLTISALPPRGKIGTSAASGAGKAKAKSPAKPSAAGRLNFAPAPAAPASPTKRKENGTTVSTGKGRKEPAGRKTPTPAGRATTTRGATTTASRTTASSKARKEPSSDTESYLASDTSFDGDELEAAMAAYDNY